MEAISVVGLGRLGLGLAACLAGQGFDTLGIDIDPGVVEAVNRGQVLTAEPGVGEIVARHGGRRLRATGDPGEAIRSTEVTFLLVGTPSNPDGTFSNRHLEAALSGLATALGTSQKAKGGLSFGGSCFPRDTHAFLSFAESCGISGALMQAVNQVNESHTERLVIQVLKEVRRHGTNRVGILGLSFKPGTPVLTQSAAGLLAKALAKQGIEVLAADPLVSAEAAWDHFGAAVQLACAQDCIDGCAVCVIAHPTDAFKATVEGIRPTRQVTVIDPWRVVDPGALDPLVHHLPFGRPAATSDRPGPISLPA